MNILFNNPFCASNDNLIVIWTAKSVGWKPTKVSECYENVIDDGDINYESELSTYNVLSWFNFNIAWYSIKPSQRTSKRVPLNREL